MPDKPEGVISNRPQLQVLSADQRQQIHRASLTVLERTGVQVMLPEAVELLRAAGARVSGQDRVRIPAHLVEAAIHNAPSQITICDRKGWPVMDLADQNSYYGTGPTIQYVYDVYSGERRDTTKADIEKAALICDYLPNIDFVMTMGMTGGINPKLVGMNPEITDRHDFEAMLRHTTKPIVFSTWSRQGLEDVYEMATAVCGGEALFQRHPFAIHFAEPTSPLLHSAEALEKLLFCAQKAIPVVYVGAPLMGGTGPVTPAGGLVLCNAEVLSGLVVAQLKRRGAPFIYGAGTSPLDMRTSTSPYCTPEAYLSTIGGRELAVGYGLPDFNLGGVTDAKHLDEQAAVEAGFSLLQAALAGSSLVHDVGYMESGLTACWELMVLADELIDEIKVFLRGIAVDAETLATEVIDRVGPGGNFLSDEHTFRHFKKIWYPRLKNRADYQSWVQSGSHSLGRVLNEKVRWILENHVPEPLDDATGAEIQKILKRSAAEAG